MTSWESHSECNNQDRHSCRRRHAMFWLTCLFASRRQLRCALPSRYRDVLGSSSLYTGPTVWITCAAGSSKPLQQNRSRDCRVCFDGAAPLLVCAHDAPGFPV